MSENLKNELANLQEMFKDFKTSSSANEPRVQKDDLLKKYFSPRNNLEVFRPLPPLEGRKPIEVAFFHRIETRVAGGKKQYATLYCPTHNDLKIHKKDENGNPMYDGTKPVLVHAPCPLCDEYNRILKQQDNSILGKKEEELNSTEKAIKENNAKIYKEAVQWKADKYYIIKGIDKGAIKDGPKFWRFKHNWKNQGTLDKLLPAMSHFTEAYEVPYYDIENGADFSITSTDSSIGNIKFKSIVSVMASKSKLHEDANVVKSWLNDETIWRDVFKPRRVPNITYEEYLQLIVEGNTPYWDETDQNNKRWIFPNNPKLETLANTRTMNLDNSKMVNVEQASDLVNTNKFIPPAEHTPIVETEKDESKQEPEVQEQPAQGQSMEEPKKPKIDVSSFVETESQIEKEEVYDDSEDDDGSDENEYDDLPF